MGGDLGSLGQSSPCPAIPWGATLPPSICVLLTASLPASVPWPLAPYSHHGSPWALAPLTRGELICISPSDPGLQSAALASDTAKIAHSELQSSLLFMRQGQEVGDPGRLGRRLLVWAVGSDCWGWLLINPKTWNKAYSSAERDAPFHPVAVLSVG